MPDVLVIIVEFAIEMKGGGKAAFPERIESLDQFVEPFFGDEVADESAGEAALDLKRAIVDDAGRRDALRHEKKAVGREKPFVTCPVQGGGEKMKGMYVGKHVANRRLSVLER